MVGQGGGGKAHCIRGNENGTVLLEIFGHMAFKAASGRGVPELQNSSVRLVSRCGWRLTSKPPGLHLRHELVRASDNRCWNRCNYEAGMGSAT